MTIRHRRKNIPRAHEIEMIWSRRAPPGPYPLVLVLDNLKAGFNVGKIVRSANALGLREVVLVGIPAWDPALARGALKATRTRSFARIEDALAALADEGYAFYALHPRAENALGATEFPEKTAFLVGHEEFGFSFDLSARADVARVGIPQVGIVESMNVSVAASIAAYEYLRGRRLLGTAKPIVEASEPRPPRASPRLPLP